VFLSFIQGISQSVSCILGGDLGDNVEYENISTKFVLLPAVEELQMFYSVQTTYAYFCEIAQMATLVTVLYEL
jgi:hypothetical protein